MRQRSDTAYQFLSILLFVISFVGFIPLVGFAFASLMMFDDGQPVASPDAVLALILWWSPPVIALWTAVTAI